MFIIKDFQVSIAEKAIIKGIDLEVAPDTIHVLMGPNGSGKSTLANSLMGHPKYTITKGKILLDKQNITELRPDQKAQAGLFLSLQYPPEIAGVTVAQFLRTAWQAVHQEKISALDFFRFLQPKMALLNLEESFAQRQLNVGFSGGEKKKMEMLQLITLEPKYAVLDETDSGLDIDALKLISKAIVSLKKTCHTGFIIITHYQRFLNHLTPDFVHIMSQGKIIRSGDKKLAKEIEKNGFNVVKKVTKKTTKA